MKWLHFRKTVLATDALEAGACLEGVLEAMKWLAEKTKKQPKLAITVAEVEKNAYSYEANNHGHIIRWVRAGSRGANEYDRNRDMPWISRERKSHSDDGFGTYDDDGDGWSNNDFGNDDGNGSAWYTRFGYSEQDSGNGYGELRLDGGSWREPVSQEGFFLR